jgi:carbon monoxide dehydrogenase subunit G
MRLVVTETLNAPLEAVFAVVCDPRRRLEWMRSLLHVQVNTAGEPRIGTSWSEVTRGGFAFALEITEFERPKRWAERAHGRFADARLGLDLEAVNAGSTRLTLGVDVDFKGLAKLGAPLVKAALPVALRGDLRRVEVLARRAAAN